MLFTEFTSPYSLNTTGVAQFKFITTFVTNDTIDFKVTRVTLFASSVHIIAVITCVTEVTKLPVFTTDPFATMVTLLTMEVKVTMK